MKQWRFLEVKRAKQVLLGIGIFVTGAFLLSPTAFASPAPHVVINEIFTNPVRGSGQARWIELYNPTDVSVDISSWRVVIDGCSTQNVGTVIPVGTVLATKAFYTYDVTTGCTMKNESGHVVRLMTNAISKGGQQVAALAYETTGTVETFGLKIDGDEATAQTLRLPTKNAKNTPDEIVTPPKQDIETAEPVIAPSPTEAVPSVQTNTPVLVVLPDPNTATPVAPDPSVVVSVSEAQQPAALPPVIPQEEKIPPLPLVLPVVKDESKTPILISQVVPVETSDQQIPPKNRETTEYTQVASLDEDSQPLVLTTSNIYRDPISVTPSLQSSQKIALQSTVSVPEEQEKGPISEAADFSQSKNEIIGQNIADEEAVVDGQKISFNPLWAIFLLGIGGLLIGIKIMKRKNKI